MTIRSTVLGKPPSNLLLVLILFCLALCLVALNAIGGKHRAWLAGAAGGIFPHLLLLGSYKKIDRELLKSDEPFLKPIDQGRQEAGLKSLRVSYIVDNELPYPVMIGSNVTITPTIINNYTSEEIRWAIRVGSRTTVLTSRLLCVMFFSFPVIVFGCKLIGLKIENPIFWGALGLWFVGLLASFPFAEYSSDRWATKTAEDRNCAAKVLNFAYQQQLLRPKERRFAFIPIWELRSRAKLLGISLSEE